MCGKNLKNKYYIEEEIKSGWKPENACYLSMQNVVSSSFIFTITICGDIILPVVLHGLRFNKEWVKLHNLELSDLNFRLNIVG